MGAMHCMNPPYKEDKNTKKADRTETIYRTPETDVIVQQINMTINL